MQQIQMFRSFHFNVPRNKMWSIDRNRRAFRDTGLPTFALEYPFSPLFGQLCATWALFWLFLGCIFSNFFFYRQHFYRKQKRDPAFLSCPRRPCLFTTRTRMLSRAILRDFLAGYLLACTLGTILGAVKKPFRASLMVFFSYDVIFS